MGPLKEALNGVRKMGAAKALNESHGPLQSANMERFSKALLQEPQWQWYVNFAARSRNTVT